MPLARLRKIVVFDRLLARLLMAAPDRWLLKGAVALSFRLGSRFRTTRDIDFARGDDEAAATGDFLAAQALDLGDHFTFIIERTHRLDAVLEGTAVRYHATTQLAGRPFEEIIVDVGFGDLAPRTADIVRSPDLLVFADIEPTTVPALPLDEHIAEKLHAYARTYGGGYQSTRVKDLVDLVLIQSSFEFQAGRLRAALRATFEHRQTHELPRNFPLPPTGWSPAYRKMAGETGLQPDIGSGYEAVAAFLDPVLDGTTPEDARWQPGMQLWTPGPNP